MRLDISHHFGPLTCFFIEQEGRKLILMGPGAQHPEHWHPNKVESFRLLWGDATVTSQVGRYDMVVDGDTLDIQPRDRHSFSTVNGCVLEELGMTDVAIYTNDVINVMPREERKTYIEL